MSADVIQVATEKPVDVEPVARPTPVAPSEYRSDTCPLCYRDLDQRIRGLYCPRCRGWLVEETRGGTLVYNLWQGRP